MAGGVMFAELHMLSGERQESSDLVGVANPPLLSLFKRRRGQLFTVVEPNIPGATTLCRRLITTIEDEYFRDSSRSVTNSLREAIAAANELLRAENSKAPPDTQLRVGLSCSAVREGDVYIAQVAPANAFILHDGTVKRVFSTYSVIPNISGDSIDRASDSLGSQLDPHINFAYSLLSEGDLIALSSGAYWKLIPDRYIFEASKHLDPEMAASDLYSCYIAHARRPTTSLVVIKISDLPARRTGNGRGRVQDPRPALVEMAELSTLPNPPVEAEELPRVRTGNGSYGSRSISTRDRDKPLPQQEKVRPAPAQTKARGSAARAETVARPSLLNWLKSRLARKGGPNQRSSPPLEEVGRPSVKLKEQWPQRWSDRDERPEWVAQLALTLALAAVFVIIGNIAINSWKAWQLGDPVALMKEAEEKKALAAAADNPASARAALAEAYELASRAQRAKDNDATRSLAATALADLDKMDRTERISQATVLLDYTPIVNEKGNVTQLALDGENLNVLDDGLDRLYHYKLTQDGKGVREPGKHSVVMKRGDKIDGTPLGELLSITWMPAGQLRTSPALFTLETGRSIVAFDQKGNFSRVDVAENQKWGTIQAISGFAGGLYLLDTKLKVIFYYPPTKNGYESEPYTIVDARAKVDLSKGVDIALDGNLYVLESGGTIKRFNREGRPFDFAADLPDGPIKGPKALFANANTRSLYVVDSLGERIIQFSPEGKLQRQFKPLGKEVSFKELRDIFVDEAGRKLYVLAHKSLFVFDIPPMQ